MPPKNRLRITKDAIAKYAKGLHILGNTLNSIADQMQEQGIESLFAYNMPSGVEGMTKIAAFAGAITEGFDEHATEEAISLIDGAMAEYKRLTKRLDSELLAGKHALAITRTVIAGPTPETDGAENYSDDANAPESIKLDLTHTFTFRKKPLEAMFLGLSPSGYVWLNHSGGRPDAFHSTDFTRDDRKWMAETQERRNAAKLPILKDPTPGELEATAKWIKTRENSGKKSDK